MPAKTIKPISRKIIFLFPVALLGFFLGSKIGVRALSSQFPSQPLAEKRPPVIKKQAKSEIKAVGFKFYETSGIRWITPKELKRVAGSGSVLILDVRSAEIFKAGHIAGAESLPLEVINEHEVILPKDKNIILYGDDTSFVEAKEAKDKLQEKNITNTFIFSQTFTDWQKEDSPIDSGDLYGE